MVCSDNCIKEAEAVFSGPGSAKLTALYNKVDLLLKGFSDFKLIVDNQEEMSQCMRFPTMWNVRPATPQISLRIRAI